MALARRLVPLAAFVGCTLVWGSTWAAIKWGLGAVPPFTAAGLRFTLASVVLFVALPLIGARLPGTRTEWSVAGFVGVIMFGVDFALIYWAEQFVASGLAAVLFSTMPLWTLLLAAGLGLERVTVPKLGGIVLGVAGVAVLFADGLGAGSTPWLPALALVGSAVGAAAASVAMKRYARHMTGVSLMAPAMAVGALVLFLFAALAREPLVMPTATAAWGSIAYLALGGSVFTFLTFQWLIKRWDASRASFVTILTPLMALLLGAVAFREPLTLRIAAGSLLVLVGVALALNVRSASRPAESRPPDAA